MGVLGRRGCSKFFSSNAGGGEGVDIALVGTVERLPEVVKGVRSRTSGKNTLILFLAAY